MPSMRATVTVAEAAPNAAVPTASIAAVERVVTVRPNPNPKMAMRPAISPTSVADDQADIRTSAVTLKTRPTTVTARGPRARGRNPEPRAPTAVAPARAPRPTRG